MQEILNLKNVSEWGYLVNKLLNNREISTENEKDWRIVSKYSKELQIYFEVMNYDLRIDENNWFVYLEEFEEMEVESLSKKQRLSFWVTLFLVILREYLYKKEQENIYSNAYIISFEEIKDLLWVFLREKYEWDEKKLASEINIIINKTKELGLISELQNKKYKINKIIKAKLSVDKMEEIYNKLKWEDKQEIGNDDAEGLLESLGTNE